MASLELKKSSYEVTGRIMLVEYDTDVWLTKVQLSKNGIDFIDALAFSQLTAMFDLTEWDNGDYNDCILRGYYDDETVFVDSNKFSIKVNKNITPPELGKDGRVQSIITVYKGDEQLIPTEEIPSDGQFRVAISSTENCSASIKDLNTIYVNYIASNADDGVITLDIDVEGKANFVKRIKLVKSVTRETVSEIEKKVNIAEQRITDDAITNMVKKDFYTKDETNTKISLVEQTVDNWGVRIVENEKTLTELKLTDEEFEVSIGKKADTTNIISMINASSEGIKIQGSKVNVTGFVTFSDLSSAGQTTINGANITTGYISCDRLKGGTISAADEINFIGGARIFGNEGEFDAGLTVSAAGITLTGGSANYLGGSWLIQEGDLEIENGDLVLNSGYKIDCYSIDATNITSDGIIECARVETTGDIVGNNNIYAKGDKLVYHTGNKPTASDVGALSKYGGTISGALTASGTIKGDRLETNGDVVCNNVWASNKVYANNVALTSDISLKTDIKYVNVDTQTIGDTGLISPNVNITTSDMHTFIETLPMVSYRMTKEFENGIDYTYYGFIAQDILYSKVGSELIENGTITETEEILDEDGNIIEGATTTREILRYSENKFIAFLAGAVKEEIRQRKALEREIMLLKQIIEKKSN